MTYIIAYKGNVVHSVTLGELEVLQPGLVGVNEHGVIVFVRNLDLWPLDTHRFDELVDLGDHLLIPGFIDGHTHASQYSFVGVGMHVPLLQWLETYTFPYESKFQSRDYARDVYEKAVRRHLHNGTTTCSYFATIHLEACKVLTDIVEEMGQRGYIGKVNMDRNGTSVITPRFVPTCSSELMRALAEISNEHKPKLPIQSHLDENQDEISWVKSLHPESKTYTDVYLNHGLLHERTYLAHCIWCSKGERDILRDKQTAVIHCPNSNFSLSSGILNVRRLLQIGIKVGLGTDVSGGYSPSMLDAIRQAIIASKLVSMGNGSSSDEVNDILPKPLTYADAFHLATVGSAEALGLSDKVGNFMIGKSFDALVVDPYAANSPIDETLDQDEDVDVLHMFQKFLFLGDDRNIVKVFVNGRQVKNNNIN